MGKDSGGGGGQQSAAPSQSTSYQASLQPELMPYAQDIAGKAQTLSAANYTPYQGQRIAGFDPMQQQAFQKVQNQQVAPSIQQGTNLAANAGVNSLMAGQNYAQQAQDPNAMAAYMSPYMQNAVDVQKNQAVLDYQRQMPAQQAQATNAGAFGGSRQAIVQGMGNEALQRQLGQIQGAGTQQAYQQAQQAQQYGAGLGMQGYGQALQAAGQLGQLGGQQFGQEMGITSALQQAGATQQNQQQQQLSQQYQDFLKQQEYPYSQLSFYNSMIRGLSPVMPTTTQTYTQPPNYLAQLGGLGLGAYSVGKMTGMV